MGLHQLVAWLLVKRRQTNIKIADSEMAQALGVTVARLKELQQELVQQGMIDIRNGATRSTYLFAI